MLRDIWGRATSVVGTLSENISNALDQLDIPDEDYAAEARVPAQLNKGNNELTINRASHEGITPTDLDIYKKMLEDAQMHHVHFSRKMTAIILEKDAQIANFLSSRQAESTDESQTLKRISTNSFDFSEQQRLVAENSSLQKSIQELEGQYQSALKQSNEAGVLISKFETLQIKLKQLLEDYSLLKSDSDNRDKQKSETIENLVREYSLLSADSELRQTEDTKRITEIVQENEILATKMHALEFSINEIADRALSSPPSGGLANPGSPSRISSSSSDTNMDLNSSEMKELRACLINTQYDLKKQEAENTSLLAKVSQQHEEMDALRNQLKDRASADITCSHVNTTDLEDEIQKLTKELSNLQHDKDRLVVEKREADDAGRNFFEKNRDLQLQLQKQKDFYEDQLTLAAVASTNHDASNSLQESEKFNRLEKTIANLQCQVSMLEAALSESEQSLVESKKEVASFESLQIMIASKESIIDEKNCFIDKLELEIAALQQTLADKTEEVVKIETQSLEKLSTLTSEVDRLTIELKESQQTLQMTKNDAASQQKQLSMSCESFQSNVTTLEAEICRLQSDVAVATQFSKVKSQEQAKADKIASDKLIGLQSEIDRLRSALQASENALQMAKVEAEASSSALIAARIEVQEKTKQAIAAAAAAETKLQISNQAIADWENAMTHLESELGSKAIRERDELVTLLNQERMAALEAAALAANTAHEAALRKLQEEFARQLLDQNEKLIKEKIAEKEELNAVAKRELQSQIERLTKEANENLLVVERKFQAQLVEMDDAFTSLKNTLDSVEVRFREQEKESLSNLERKMIVERNEALLSLKNELNDVVEDALSQKKEYIALFNKEHKLRKSVHNKLLDLQGNIRVFCRVRPVLEVERRSGEDVDVTGYGPSPDDLSIQKDPQTKTKFEYDRVFAPGSTQEDVFEAVQPLLVSVLDGFNICIFAYGQTGSGKTFTMEGYDGDHGVSPRAITELFRIISEAEDTMTYTLTFSMLEIYNETILDLLDSSRDKDKLDIRQTPEGNTVPGLTEVVITAPPQVFQLMKQGQKNRAVGSHDMNERSSRSHSILTIVCRGKSKLEKSTVFGKLNLIDLAGSERVGKTDAQGDRLKEAQNINRSLSALGDVISALGNKKSAHVPYRNSKLTFLLQDSLGGNSKVLMFVNISPAVYNLGETLCSLGFATRCRNVELGQAKRQSDDGKQSSIVKKAIATFNATASYGSASIMSSLSTFPTSSLDTTTPIISSPIGTSLLVKKSSVIPSSKKV